MKPTLCRICRTRAATGQAIGKVMAAYAKPTPVCDKCGAEYEARQGRVEWKTKQRFLPDEIHADNRRPARAASAGRQLH